MDSTDIHRLYIVVDTWVYTCVIVRVIITIIETIHRYLHINQLESISSSTQFGTEADSQRPVVPRRWIFCPSKLNPLYPELETLSEHAPPQIDAHTVTCQEPACP